MRKIADLLRQLQEAGVKLTLPKADQSIEDAKDASELTQDTLEMIHN